MGHAHISALRAMKYVVLNVVVNLSLQDAKHSMIIHMAGVVSVIGNVVGLVCNVA